MSRTPGGSPNSCAPIPRVAWVNYAGFPDDRYHALAEKYLGGKATPLLTFGVKGGLDAGKAFYDALGLIKRLVNIGDAKSLACHPASTTHRQMSRGGTEGGRRRAGNDPPEHRHRTPRRHHRRPRSGARRRRAADEPRLGRGGELARSYWAFGGPTCWSNRRSPDIGQARSKARSRRGPSRPKARSGRISAHEALSRGATTSCSTSDWSTTCRIRRCSAPSASSARLLRAGAGDRLNDLRIHLLSLGGVARGPEARRADARTLCRRGPRGRHGSRRADRDGRRAAREIPARRALLDPFRAADGMGRAQHRSRPSAPASPPTPPCCISTGSSDIRSASSGAASSPAKAAAITRCCATRRDGLGDAAFALQRIARRPSCGARATRS